MFDAHAEYLRWIDNVTETGLKEDLLSISDNENEIEDAFLMVKGEAGKAFGNDDIFMEKYLVNPKHIEVQILADKYGVETWSNIESFDRDMPWLFPPIKWEKFLWKLESAEAAGIKDGITFEFSHFMSPHSMYPSAHGLYDRYCEHFGIPSRSKDFK